MHCGVRRFSPAPTSMSNQPYKLVIVIVCYRSAKLAVDALQSLRDEIPTVPHSHVIVCENGTGPESVQIIADAIAENGWSDWVTMRIIHPNRGFAGGNNAVLREIVDWEHQPEYVMLLNSDTIVRPGSLASLVRAADDHPDAGIIGPRLEWPDGDSQGSCFRFITPISQMLAAARTAPFTRMFAKWDVPVAMSDEPHECDWLSFACAIIRMQTMREVGVLDDGYYLYFDDVDYCRMAHLKGWKTLYWPDAHVVHLRGQSNPLKELQKQCKRRPAYFYQSRTRYFAKFHGGVVGVMFANVLWHTGRAVSLLREWAGMKAPHICEAEARDNWTNWLDPMNASRVTTQQDMEQEAASAPVAHTTKDESDHAAA